MKAPIVHMLLTSGRGRCPACGDFGPLGTPCATCTRAAHGTAMQVVQRCRRETVAKYGPRCDAVTMLLVERKRRTAAWRGAEVLIDHFPGLLQRVGLELPQVETGRP
jgi:hypothetical protein